MRAIFISYRRDDTEGHAGRLFEDLRDRFGKHAVFMDVAGIEPGRDFRRVIEQQVASCGVLLALIGKNWLTAADANGKRRLDDAADFVRLETASALKRDIPVIPVLVHDAAMPRAEQLPDDLKDLAFRNGVELTHARWSSDVQLLIDALLPQVDAAPPVPAPARPPDRHLPWMSAALTVFVLGGVGYVAWDRLAPSPAPPPPGDAALAPGRFIAVAPAASAPSPAAASAPAPVAVAPLPAPAPAPAQESAPARVIDKALIAKPPPAPKPVVKAAAPTATTATPAARPSSASVPTASPAPLPVPSTQPAPAPAPAPLIAPTPVPSAEALASRDPGSDLFGSAATASMVTRRIVIKPETGYVNVTGGEVIRFDVGGKSFVWNFNGTRSSFDLGLIAPAGLLGRKVTAYVAPNPMYPKGS